MFKKKKAAEPKGAAAAFDPLSLVNKCTPQQMVQQLGNNVDNVDENGWTCLHHAANLGYVPHIEALLDAVRRMPPPPPRCCWPAPAAAAGRRRR